MLDRELKKGSVEVLILALLAERPRHGYAIGKEIEQRSEGVLTFKAPSLYPVLYRLERRGHIRGEWDGKKGERRRRQYRLTEAGQRALAEQRRTWRTFIGALERVAGLHHA